MQECITSLILHSRFASEVNAFYFRSLEGRCMWKQTVYSWIPRRENNVRGSTIRHRRKLSTDIVKLPSSKKWNSDVGGFSRFYLLTLFKAINNSRARHVIEHRKPPIRRHRIDGCSRELPNGSSTNQLPHVPLQLVHNTQDSLWLYVLPMRRGR